MAAPEQVPPTPVDPAEAQRIRDALERHRVRENARDLRRQPQPNRRRPA